MLIWLFNMPGEVFNYLINVLFCLFVFTDN